MTPLRAQLPLIRLGVLLLLGAVLAGGWELLARQSPGTPFYIGTLPGPVSALRELTTTLGFGMLITSLFLGWSGQVVPHGLMWLLCGGTLTCVGAQLYGAASGMPGVQVVDFRPGVRPLFMTKQLALLLVIGVLFELWRRVLARPETPWGELETRSGSRNAQLDPHEPRH